MPDSVEKDVKSIAKSGGTPLVVASKDQVLGTVYLKDVVKGGLRDRFARFRAMGIRTVMITGDNPLTASAIALKAGIVSASGWGASRAPTRSSTSQSWY